MICQCLNRSAWRRSMAERFIYQYMNWYRLLIFLYLLFSRTMFLLCYCYSFASLFVVKTDISRFYTTLHKCISFMLLYRLTNLKTFWTKIILLIYMVSLLSKHADAFDFIGHFCQIFCLFFTVTCAIMSRNFWHNSSPWVTWLQTSLDWQFTSS